jgi:hypothetical protein
MPYFRCVSVIALGFLLMTPTKAVQAAVVGQAPCVVDEETVCYRFKSGASIPPLRSIRFFMRKVGDAIATFHGALYCASTTDGQKIIDLATQINLDKADNVDFSGPGGLRHVAILYNATEGVSFNLSSTRVINYKSIGKKQIFFNMKELFVNASTTCYAYNLTFTVVTPD